MLRISKFFLLLFLGPLVFASWMNEAHSFSRGNFIFQDLNRADTIPQDTTKKDSLANSPYEPTKQPDFDPEDRLGDPFSNRTTNSPFFLRNPSSLKLDVEIDTGMNYTIYEKIGDINYRPTSTMSFEEFSQLQDQRMIKDYWKTRSAGLDGESAVSGRRLIPPIYISPIFDRIFGGSFVDIRPNGFVTLDFGGRWQRIDNPSIPIRQQRNGGFEFDQQISMNVVGKIGDKMSITANFDNNNSFDFENDLKVEYTGYEEDIIKKIEIGNVSLPINNSLMTGAQNLFGVKTQLQFGRLFVTGVASSQRGKTDVIEVEGGSQGREFEIRASDYDENRHFFLGHFFRENYENWLRGIPQVISGVNVTRVEVYVMNRNNNTETLRNFAAFMDMAEGGPALFLENNPLVAPSGGVNPNTPPTDNQANQLFSNLTSNPGLRSVDEVDATLSNEFNMSKGRDYVVVSPARKLDPEKEYIINPQLGIISLFRKLQNDEVLAVSYEYTYNGQRFKVGELMEDYQNRDDNEVIFLKMLRPNKINTDVPTWELMMKNIYNLNASQVAPEGFELRIVYRDDKTGIDNPSLHEGILTKDEPLVEIMNLDRLNMNNDPQPDGNFDYVEGITIVPESGLIVFPVLKPFGEHLKQIFQRNNETALINKYVYDTLYSTTKADAELVAGKNKFFIVGQFQAGSSREIVLQGINIAENSVRVYAGNTPLTEGVDYRVDYNLGKVSLLNEGVLNSGKRIRITYEKADLFNFQSRSLFGSRMDYRFNDNFNLGATLLYANERPLISRVSIGDEPIRNLKYGLDINYRKESRFLTKMVDALPFMSTKEPSTVNFSAEIAQLRPGTSNKVTGSGTSYIDDFESSLIPFNLGSDINSWKLASTPRTENNLFNPQVGPGNLGKGYKRAKLSWYIIDNLFYRDGGRLRPDVPPAETKDFHYTREIQFDEVFPGRDQELINAPLRSFDIAFFPDERGPYNYNPNLTSQGFLNEPEENWGGITRAITSDVDFDKNNIEYIEFWLMDPFIEGEFGRVLDGRFNENNRNGGDLYFNLGNISEDVIPNSRHDFENGLPANDPPQQPSFVETEWGRTTTQQYLTNAFDNSVPARTNQDVGWDGFKDEDERTYETFVNEFINRVPQAARDIVLEDVSADNFEYFLGPEADGKSVLQRYKNFNGQDRNSPVLANNNLLYTPSGSTIPDNEDLNNDNTVSDLEEYYEYKVNLRPDRMRIGENYIVDKQTGKEGIDWYLFRIPIREPDKIVGDIQGYKSIRFVRMYMSDFERPVVLRMLKFQLVGSQWRRYLQSLEDPSLREIPEPEQANFVVSAVNIEENSNGGDDDVQYVLPPGIRRDLDVSSPIYRETNEQSIQMCVEDLKDRDARAIFKNVNLDLINYGRIKMFLHANSSDAVDGELTAFLRFGTDFTENYYEIEVPMKLTPLGTSGPGIEREVWPLENEIDISFNELYALKKERNRLNINVDLPFTDVLPRPQLNTEYRITVRGRPDMSTVQTLMIGLRNPKSDDQSPKSACLWANELRVTDFDSNAGYAANARLSTKLADFANVTASTRYISFGFGGVQQRISERTREEIQEFDVSANITLDKLLPESLGLKIPMFVSYENSVITPQFDPLDPDIPLEAALQSFNSEEERQNYRDIVQDQATRRSINFTNVHKVKVKEDAKSRIFDIENFSLSYAFSDINQSSIYKADYILRSYRGSITYNYNPEQVIVEPFKNIGFLKSPWLALIRDFNFSPVPTNLFARGDLDRRFVKTQLRNANLTTVGIKPNYEKFFTFNRQYSLRWDFTQSLSMDFNARTNAIIDEPEGDIDTETKRDSIWSNIKRLGRMKNYDQDLDFRYTLPLDKIPITDWVSSDLGYSTGYSWLAGSINQADSLGNTISNSRDQTIGGKFNLVQLYDKIKFLKEINSPPRRPPTRRQENDTTEQKPDLKLVKGFFRTLMALRSVNFNYSIRESTILPGFMPAPTFFGLDSGFNAPGLEFVLGSQNPDIRHQAAMNGWLAPSPFLTNSFMQARAEDLTLGADIEPFKDFRIRLDAKKTVTARYQEIFRFDTVGGFNDYRTFTPSRSGDFRISFLTINTAFIPDDTSNVSPVFQNFERYREIIRNRLATDNPSNGEYQINSQDVLIPAFIAAYTGRDPNNVNLSPAPRIPIPNWRIDYRGLSNIPELKEVFSSISLTHAYNSTLSLNGYTNSLDYQDNLELTNRFESYPLASQTNDNNEFIPVYVINQVVLSERFNPLIGLTLNTRSRLQTRIEYRRERNLALNLSNAQVTELNSKDINFSFSLTKANMRLPFKANGQTIVLENDISFKLDFTIRDTKTIQRKIEDTNTVTSGNINYQLRPTISYVVNQRLNLQMYFSRNINEPRITSSFPRRTSEFGVQVRFSLSQ